MAPSWQKGVTDYLEKIDGRIETLNGKFDKKISEGDKEFNDFKILYAREMARVENTIKILAVIGTAALFTAVGAVMKLILK